MARHIVCLTFDFDTMSGFIARGLTTPTPISRGEFGVVAADRILALCRKYDIATTWFTPGFTIETYPESCKRVLDAGHEFGHHGWTHMPPASWATREEEEADMVRGNEAIHRLTGAHARGYRSPAWDLSPHTIDLLLSHGFVYDSSLMGNDYQPYRARRGDVIDLQQPMRFGETTPLVEMPISWSVDDFPHFEFLRTPTHLQEGGKSANDVLANWIDDFTYMTEITDWGILTYTCHPYVIGRGHRMMMLERLIRSVLDRGGEFLTMAAAVDAFLEREASDGG